MHPATSQDARQRGKSERLTIRETLPSQLPQKPLRRPCRSPKGAYSTMPSAGGWGCLQERQWISPICIGGPAGDRMSVSKVPAEDQAPGVTHVPGHLYYANGCCLKQLSLTPCIRIDKVSYFIPQMLFYPYRPSCWAGCKIYSINQSLIYKQPLSKVWLWYDYNVFACWLML